VAFGVVTLDMNMNIDMHGCGVVHRIVHFRWCLNGFEHGLTNPREIMYRRKSYIDDSNYVSFLLPIDEE
jgi:hypothetical protein